MHQQIIKTLFELIPGFVGAILSLRYSPHIDTWPEYFWGIAGGTASAYWGTPLIVELLGMEKHFYAFAFFIGLFGMSLFAAVFRAMASADLWALVREAVQALIGRIGK